MKHFCAVSVLAIVGAEMRNPVQRLTTLRHFAAEWISDQIGVAINRPERAFNKVDAIERLSERLLAAYEKPCGFFDPNLEHGGPNPNSNRKRRAALAKAELERIAREVVDNDDIDIFDKMEANYESGTTNVLSVSNDPELAWKQIKTGFRKWILRYISDCSGQKKRYYHTNRLDRVIF